MLFGRLCVMACLRRRLTVMMGTLLDAHFTILVGAARTTVVICCMYSPTPQHETAHLQCINSSAYSTPSPTHYAIWVQFSTSQLGCSQKANPNLRDEFIRLRCKLRVMKSSTAYTTTFRASSSIVKIMCPSALRLVFGGLVPCRTLY